MAVKSDNTKGNPYHDDEGKFTSESGQSSKEQKIATVLPSTNQIKLKIGADLNQLKQEIAAKSNPLENDLIMPKSIQEAEEQGNKIIGSTLAVGYDDSTDIAVAFDFNCALKDITKDFKEIMIRDNIWIYGTKNRRQSPEILWEKITFGVIQRPEYQKRIADLGLTPNDVSNLLQESVERFSMFESGYNSSTLQKGCGGSTGFIEGNFNAKPVIMVGSSIKFNTLYSQSKASMDKYPISAIAEGHFLPIGDKSGAYMVAVHELGHHVFEKLKTYFSDADNQQLEQVLTDGKGYGAFRVVPALFGSGINDYQNLQKAKEISGYATVSQHEHVAEAFANVYCVGDNATTHNKKIVKFLKSVYERVFGQ